MPALTQSNNLGDLLKYEAPNLYSRERGRLALGQNLILGTVLGQITSSGLLKRLDPSASDGTQLPCGVLLADCDASLIERDEAVLAARHAIVAEHALIWPSGITLPEIRSASAALSSLGVLIRTSV